MLLSLSLLSEGGGRAGAAGVPAGVRRGHAEEESPPATWPAAEALKWLMLQKLPPSTDVWLTAITPRAPLLLLPWLWL